MACEMKKNAKIGQDERVYVGQDPMWTWQPQHNSYIGASTCTTMHILTRMQVCKGKSVHALFIPMKKLYQINYLGAFVVMQQIKAFDLQKNL